MLVSAQHEHVQVFQLVPAQRPLWQDASVHGSLQRSLWTVLVLTSELRSSWSAGKMPAAWESPDLETGNAAQVSVLCENF